MLSAICVLQGCVLGLTCKSFSLRYIRQLFSTLIVHLNLFQVFLSCSFVAKRTKSPVTGFRPFEIDNTAFLASRAVQTAPALRTTNCWRYCRFAEQIYESQATSLGWLLFAIKGSSLPFRRSGTCAVQRCE